MLYIAGGSSDIFMDVNFIPSFKTFNPALDDKTLSSEFKFVTDLLRIQCMV